MPDFVACPVARRKKKRAKYLVMWTAAILKDGQISPDKKLKFAGGMARPDEAGNTRATCARELLEETGLILPPEAPMYGLIVVRHPEHDKRFVLVWRRNCGGSLRKVPIDDGDTMLYPPFFADKEYLEKYLYGDHREVLPFLPN